MRCSKLMILTGCLTALACSSASAQTGGSILATARVIDTSLEWSTHAAAIDALRIAASAASGRGASVRREVGPASIAAVATARKEGIEGSLNPLVTITYW